MLRGAEQGFSSERSPSGSEGGWSEELKNREGVASGSATEIFIANYFSCRENQLWKTKNFFQSEKLQRC